MRLRGTFPTVNVRSTPLLVLPLHILRAVTAVRKKRNNPRRRLLRPKAKKKIRKAKMISR